MVTSFGSGSGITIDDTFTHRFKSKPLGISLGPVGATGTKVTKVSDPSIPVKIGDVVVSIEKKAVTNMPYKAVAKKLQSTALPFSILFVRPSKAAQGKV